MATRILAVGHSHLTALLKAWNQRLDENTGAAADIELDFLQLRLPEYADPAGRKRVAPDDQNFLAPAVRKKIRAARPDVILTCLRGNEHNVLCLVEMPWPFDFSLPEEPELPLDMSREILPYDLVEQMLNERMRGVRLYMRALKNHVACRLINLEVPPPIPSEEHLRRHGGSFREKIASMGITPAIVRYKLWRTRSTIMRNICRNNGVEYLAVPPTAIDEMKMLLPQAWSTDPTHGNAWYGEQVIQHLTQYLAADEPAVAPRKVRS